MSSLPAADWRETPGIMRLIDALTADGGQARFVGGAVRDTLLGLPVKDIDIATPLLPDDVMVRLAFAGIKAVPTGIAHGTITAASDGVVAEVTTLRRDVCTDGRRATVAFSSDWREDAARRDFTINALYADPLTGAISDWFGGLDDLTARRVRFIGDATARIAEDHLRILRYFRFQARFGSQPADIEAEEACRSCAPMLKGLSRERVAMELLAILGLADPLETITQMDALGVLGVILPEAHLDDIAVLLRAERRHSIAADALRRLAALLPPDPLLAERVAARLRLSTAQKKRLMLAAARGPDDDGNPRALAYRHGMDSAVDRLLIRDIDIKLLISWNIPHFPVSGKDVIAHGVKPGPEVARLLNAAEERWLSEGFPPRETVLGWLG